MKRRDFLKAIPLLAAPLPVLAFESPNGRGTTGSGRYGSAS